MTSLCLKVLLQPVATVTILIAMMTFQCRKVLHQTILNVRRSLLWLTLLSTSYIRTTTAAKHPFGWCSASASASIFTFCSGSPTVLSATPNSTIISVPASRTHWTCSFSGLPARFFATPSCAIHSTTHSPAPCIFSSCTISFVYARSPFFHPPSNVSGTSCQPFDVPYIGSTQTFSHRYLLWYRCCRYDFGRAAIARPEEGVYGIRPNIPQAEKARCWDVVI